jgi:hypothetical protein
MTRRSNDHGNPHKDLISMGTNRSSETLALARSLRAQRTTTQAQVDEAAAEHGTLVRYETEGRAAAAAAH